VTEEHVVEARPKRGELDELTIARAKRGERPELGSFVEHYSPAVYALVGRMLGKTGVNLVDDAAQDVFVRAIRALPRFDVHGPAKLSTWLITIATRVCIDRMRKNMRQGERVVHLVDGSTDDAFEPQGNLEARQMIGLAERAMGTLPPLHRAVLILRAYHDFDYEEIAQTLGLELGTVKSRLSRAREILRKAIEERQP
jgi:RNA polymerase sigma-70 factor (ECF subfamily)